MLKGVSGHLRAVSMPEAGYARAMMSLQKLRVDRDMSPAVALKATLRIPATRSDSHNQTKIHIMACGW